MKNYIIVAPHADDEVIGCFDLLLTDQVDTIVFGTKVAMMENRAAMLKAEVHFMVDNYSCLDNYNFVSTPNKILLFPDPTYETHPLHRYIGMLGEELLRAGRQVIFYTTNMSAPYIHEVSQAAIKRSCLDSLYPAKKALWEYEHKYFLFEGYTQWIMNFNHE